MYACHCSWVCHKWFLVSLYSCKNFVIIVFKSLVSNKQLHTFPEGKVSQEDSPIRRLKWGTASLIVRAPVTPIILPIVHHGLQEVIVPTLLLFSYNLSLRFGLKHPTCMLANSFNANRFSPAPSGRVGNLFLHITKFSRHHFEEKLVLEPSFSCWLLWSEMNGGQN